MLVRRKAGIQGRDWLATVRKKYQFHITAFNDDTQLVLSFLPSHISGRSLPGREGAGEEEVYSNLKGWRGRTAGPAWGGAGFVTKLPCAPEQAQLWAQFTCLFIEDVAT